MHATIEKLKQNVVDKDFEAFKKNHFALVNLSRTLLFQEDKKGLLSLYEDMSRFYIWFYRANVPEWPEVERYMGGLEVLLDMARVRLESHSARQMQDEVCACQADRQILDALQHKDGVLASGLANALQASPGETAGRLKCLESLGLVMRLKRGRDSLVFLTPRGRKAADDFDGPRAEDAPSPSGPER